MSSDAPWRSVALSDVRGIQWRSVTFRGVPCFLFLSLFLWLRACRKKNYKSPKVFLFSSKLEFAKDDG
jgi:hypothetical protein